MSLDLKKGKGSADYLRKNPNKEETTAIYPIPQKKVDQKTSDQSEFGSSTKKPWWIFIVLLIGMSAILFFLFKGEDGGGEKEKSTVEETSIVDKKIGTSAPAPQENTQEAVDNADDESKKATVMENAKTADKTTAEKVVAPDKTSINEPGEKEKEMEKETVKNVNDYRTAPDQKKVADRMADNISTDEGRKVTIYFDYNSIELKEEEKAKLATVTSISGLQSVLIDGYTCNMGDDEYNRDLSIARAVAVREYLKQSFEGKTKLVIKGSGSENPVADNDTTEGRLKNRRVEVYY